jgi:streptogramin lyase
MPESIPALKILRARISALTLLPLCAAPFAVQAGSLAGTVTAGGKPVDGAIVSLIAPNGAMESVYTDDTGHYSLTTRQSGKLELRVRKRYHADDRRPLELGASDSQQVDVALAALTDPKAISDDHPAISHFSRIAFDADEKGMFSRGNFARDCLTCHQLGNEFTRWQRPAEGWVPSVQRMHGYLANADMDQIKRRAELLAKAFDGSLVASKPVVPTDPLIHQAKVYVWKLPGSIVPHDAEYSHHHDKVFISDMFGGEVLETNLETGETLHFRLPDEGAGPGGEFTKRGLPAPYGLTIARAPHSFVEGADGKLYLTDSIGSAITVFDPTTREFKSHAVGGGSLYPHTVRADREGIVWFSIAFSNQVGRFDPKTTESKVVNLPDTPSLSAPGTTIPYGIDVSPKDGGVWYSKLASDKIGRIDPKTLEVKEYDSPVRGPRRMRFDAAGRLWVAGFSDGAIAKIDVEQWQAEVFPLPVYAPGEIAAPYALAINPVTQEVWVNDTMFDLSWRFLPQEKRFIAYPMPTKGTYTRDFSFTKHGWACTSNNPIPAAALEGGIPELICIDPGPSTASALAAQ